MTNLGNDCPHTKRYYYYGVCEDCGAIRESAESGGERPGDETNKNVRCLAKHYSHGDGSKCVYYSEKDPVASNTGKELKPCPFCGADFSTFRSFPTMTIGGGLVHRCRNGMEIVHNDAHVCKTVWNDAWAHKRIAALEKENGLLKAVTHLCCNEKKVSTINHGASNTGKPCEHNIQATLNYQKRIAELQNEIESQKHCYRLLEEHRASLESSLEGMKKRNEELEQELNAAYKKNGVSVRAWMHEKGLKEAAEAALKTAEDKLAEVTEEKELNGRCCDKDEERP